MNPRTTKKNESLGGKENIARRVVAGHANCLSSDDLKYWPVEELFHDP
jgi:hypothetical protein